MTAIDVTQQRQQQSTSYILIYWSNSRGMSAPKFDLFGGSRVVVASHRADTFTHDSRRNNIIVNTVCDVRRSSRNFFCSLNFTIGRRARVHSRTCDAVPYTEFKLKNWATTTTTAALTFKRTSCLFTFFSHSFCVRLFGVLARACVLFTSPSEHFSPFQTEQTIVCMRAPVSLSLSPFSREALTLQTADTHSFFRFVCFFPAPTVINYAMHHFMSVSRWSGHVPYAKRASSIYEFKNE